MDSDLIFGIVVTVIFLALVFAAGIVFYKFKNMRFVKAWQPLVPIVGGTVRGDGGGAARSWLSGTYKGKPVHASMSPNAADTGRTGSATTGFAYNAFEIILQDVPGKQDWKIAYHAAQGGEPQNWQIITVDSAIKEQLRANAVIDLVAGLGYPSGSVVGAGLPVLEYRARDRQLHYREDAGPVWVPAPERFREELDVLLRIAQINAQVQGA